MLTAQADPATAALQETATELDRFAREEKRLEAFHRRRARDARRRLARLQATCRELGIALVIHHSPEGTDR